MEEDELMEAAREALENAIATVRAGVMIRTSPEPLRRPSGGGRASTR